MARTCSKLGTRLLYTKSYSPESKGKIERLNRTIDAFLSEVTLDKPQTLEELNEQFQVWLSECYQNRSHASLGENMSPETAYRSDRKALRFVSPEVVADAFLHAERRKVDKAGCINFMGKKYEVGLSVVGQTVDVIYDPADIRQLTIEYAGHTPWQAKELVIGEYAGQRPKLPPHLGPHPAKSSRLLDAAKVQHQQRQARTTPAVRYDGLWKGGNEHV